MTDPAGPAAREQLLKEFLATHDVACPRCGYNLRARASVRCPECAATAVFCWIVTAVLGSLIVTLARRRSVFLRKPPHRQRMLAVAAIVFSLIAVSAVTVLGVVFVRF